jgi:hypothetical protein
VNPSGMSTETGTTPIQVDLLKWLGERRDGFLVAGAIVYGLGYLVWSYNAWRNHLGELPALEFQYVISGLVPAGILGLAFAAAFFFFRVRKTVFALYKRHSFLRWLVPMIVAAFQVVFSLLFSATARHWTGLVWTKEQAYTYTAPILVIITYFSFFAPAADFSDQTKKVHRIYSYVFMLTSRIWMPFAFSWFSIALYLSLYPRLPQELGGPQPRCAYVDLVRDDTAPSTLSALASPSLTSAATISEGKVIRSNKLDVYFSSSDYLLVRAVGPSEAPTGGASAKEEPLYELRKEMIRAVQWCR